MPVSPLVVLALALLALLALLSPPPPPPQPLSVWPVEFRSSPSAWCGWDPWTNLQQKVHRCVLA
jgi:hypothetical protein